MKIHAAPSVIATLVLLGGLLALPGRTLAQIPMQPQLFALTADDFPSGSHVVRANIETNQRLLVDQPLHFGLPPGVTGRITGYYMDAEEQAPPGHLPPYTSYLVSIFRSPRYAQIAFDIRWGSWFAANYYTTPPSVPVALGEKGAEALFHTLDRSHPPLTELFFRRGAILVEVFQGTDSDPPTAPQIHSFWTIATKLNRITSLHPRGY